MNELWLAAVALLFVASLFIIVPCIRFMRKQQSSYVSQVHESPSHDERTEQNVLIYKERLAELQLELSKGNIDDSQYESLKQELDQALLEDAQASSTSNASGHAAETKEQPKVSALIIASISIIALIAISASLYHKYGAYNELASYLNLQEQNSQLSAATEQARNGDMSGLLEQLHAKLKENPDNIEGWSLLARTAMNVERYALAVVSFKEIIRLLKSEPERNDQDVAAALGVLAQAQYYSSKGVISADVQQTIDQAISLNPNEPNTLSLLAIDAFTSSEFEQAISYWQKVLDVYPDHPAANSMRQGVREAQRRLGIELPNTDNSSPSIEITVSLDQAFASKVLPNDTVFIFVKDSSHGDLPSPPLAASRHLVSELPITISMSDANAMSPLAKLSDASSVDIVARISKAGQVSASKGDIEGRKNSLKLQASNSADIVINRIIN